MIQDPRDMLDAARRRLRETGVPTQALGEIIVPRRFLGLSRSLRIEPRGRAWHLGALLLGDTQLYAAGEVIRAADDGRRGYTSELARMRSEAAVAAVRGGFPEGETIHLAWRGIDLDDVLDGGRDDLVFMADGELRIRWSRQGAPVPLAAYVGERVELLAEPSSPG